MALGQTAMPEDPLAAAIFKIQNSQTISQADARLLRNAARSNELRGLLERTDYEAFARQLDRYELEGVSATVRAYVTAYTLEDELKQSPRAIIRGDYEEVFLADVNFYADQMDLQKRENTELIVVEHDGTVLRLDDPVVGGNLEAIGMSCLYQSGGTSYGTPNQRYGTDMLLFDDAQYTGILIREPKREDWYVRPYVITRMAVDWEASSQRIVGYAFGYQGNQAYIPENQRGQGNYQQPESRWHRFTCNARNVEYEAPFYVPFVGGGWTTPGPVESEQSTSSR
jgi:hypothetical protein